MSTDINIVFLGDSFTNRTGVKDASNPEKRFSTHYTGNYAEHVMKRLFVHFPEKNFRFYNRGKSGDSVSDLLDRYDNDFSNLNTDIVVLLIGHNDAKKKSYNQFMQDYSVLIHKLKEMDTQIVSLSILPVRKNCEQNEKIIRFNQGIREFAQAEGYLYLDIFRYFNKILEHECDKKINLYEETMHLSELGNLYIADCVYDTIADIIK